MRAIALLGFAFAIVATAARGASPEDDYIGARNRAIATLKRLDSTKASAEAIDAAQQKALADLQKRLVAILGPFKIAGFPAVGKINLESLTGSDVGFGMLDGVAHGGADSGPRVVVTTRSLLERWLKERSAETDAAQRVPADVNAAFADDTFYTFAVGSDAAFSTTALLPVKPPAGDDVVSARLGGWAQDDGPNPDQEVVVALVRGERALIAEIPLRGGLPKIDACEAVWTAALAASDKLQQDYQKSGLKDEKLFEASTAARSKGDKDYRACLGQRLPHEAGFPAILAQAQKLADGLSQ